MPRDYFCCYHSYRAKLAKLSDQEVGRLFRALLEYSETGESPELTGRESIAFDFIADDISRSKAHYDEISTTRANAAFASKKSKSKQKEHLHTNADNTNTNTNKNTNTIIPSYNPPSAGDAFADFAQEDHALLEALRAFEASRKKQRNPLTERAKELLIGKLVQQDRTAWIPMLEEATLKGWKSVYPPKEEKQTAPPVTETFRSGPVFSDERLAKLKQKEAGREDILKTVERLSDDQ